MTINPLLDQVKEEITESLAALFEEKPDLKLIFDNICEPEKVHRWKVTWYDDSGKLQVNTCWRVQQNSCLGPYKGGLRFDSSVSLDVLRFLALEQTFKNALTGKNIGGGKGGSDFNPRGRSDAEINRFCKGFMQGLHKFVGADIDVPAGDIGVNAKVIGYLFGAWKQLGGGHTGVLTGKSPLLSGSNLRTEATGYGVIYLLKEHLSQVAGKKTKKQPLKGLQITISGSGNVATYCAKKAIELKAKVLTLSDRKRTYFCAQGLKDEDVNAILEFKSSKEEKALPKHIKTIEGKKPWEAILDENVKVNVAIPCATQNEITKDDALGLLKSGCKLLIEGSNLSSTKEAVQVLKENEKDIEYIGSKLANLGGVGTSYLEMMQNTQKEVWSSEKVDEELHKIMTDAYKAATNAAKKYSVSISDGANIAAFLKISDAMKQLGYA